MWDSPQAIKRKQILMLHLARFDAHYKNGDVLTPKEWRIILNQTVNCTGAELAQIVEKAARALFYQVRDMEIGLQELLEQREMMVPLYVRDTDRILVIANGAKYICHPASSSIGRAHLLLLPFGVRDKTTVTLINYF